MTESELQIYLDRICAGDTDAFEQVYQHTKQDVYRTIAFLVVDAQDIHDIMNEVYIQLLKSLHGYDRSKPFRFWLHGLVVRQAQDWKRKIWRRLRLLDRKKSLEVEVYAEHDEQVLRNETRREIVQAVQQLSAKLRVVVILRYYHNYSLEEIAQLLEIPLGTVKSRHHLALRQLRQTYAELFDGEVERHYVF